MIRRWPFRFSRFLGAAVERFFPRGRAGSMRFRCGFWKIGLSSSVTSFPIVRSRFEPRRERVARAESGRETVDRVTQRASPL